MACAYVCAGVVGSSGVMRGLSVSVEWSCCFGDTRQPHIVERFTRCGSNALDSAAMH